MVFQESVARGRPLKGPACVIAHFFTEMPSVTKLVPEIALMLARPVIGLSPSGGVLITWPRSVGITASNLTCRGRCAATAGEQYLSMHLINWLRLEELLARAVEGELHAWSRERSGTECFAFALEFDGVDGRLDLSFGTRECVEAAAARERYAFQAPVYYRALELRPENWAFRHVPRQDPDGFWLEAEQYLGKYRQNVLSDLSGDALEFLWLRFEFLAECVVRRLVDRGAFRGLPQASEFLAYPYHENETLEEVEDRLAKFEPRYRPSTVELVRTSRRGVAPGRRCGARRCSRERPYRGLRRCTHCQTWLCSACAAVHTHPELYVRRSFFQP